MCLWQSDDSGERGQRTQFARKREYLWSSPRLPHPRRTLIIWSPLPSGDRMHPTRCRIIPRATPPVPTLCATCDIVPYTYTHSLPSSYTRVRARVCKPLNNEPCLHRVRSSFSSTLSTFRLSAFLRRFERLSTSPSIPFALQRAFRVDERCAASRW